MLPDGSFQAVEKSIWSGRSSFGEHNLTVADYQRIAWQDFISQQIDAFGDIPIYLAIRNHELVPGLSYRQ